MVLLAFQRYLDASAVLHGAVSNAGAPGTDTLLLEGYGVLTGEDQPRCALNTSTVAAAAADDDDDSATVFNYTHADSIAGARIGELRQAGCCSVNHSPQGISTKNAKHVIVRGK